MLQTQVEQLKDNIKTEYEERINKLKEEMESALTALSKVEETLFNTKAITVDKPEYTKAKDTRRFLKTTTSKSIPARMKAALEKINGEFTRSVLFQMVLDDGEINVAQGSLASVFSGLVKAKVIIAVKESSGKRPGIYRKAKELNTQAEASPVV